MRGLDAQVFDKPLRQRKGFVSVCLQDGLHDTSAIVWLVCHSVARLDLAKDHGNAAARQLLKYCFGFLIKPYNCAVYRVLQWMPDRCSSFVMQNFNGVWPFLAPVIRPSKNSG